MCVARTAHHVLEAQVVVLDLRANQGLQGQEMVVVALGDVVLDEVRQPQQVFYVVT